MDSGASSWWRIEAAAFDKVKSRGLKAIAFSRHIRARALRNFHPKKAEGAERRKARTVETALARRGAHLAIGAQRLPALHSALARLLPLTQPRAALRCVFRR